MSSREDSLPICPHARPAPVLSPPPAPRHAFISTLSGEAGLPWGLRPGKALLLQPPARRYLAWRALRPVQRGPLLGLAEVRVVRVAAPQLLAGLEGPELRGKGNGVTGPD